MRQSLLAATFLLSLFSPTLAKADEAIRQWKGFNLGLSIGLAETDANSDGYAEGVNTDGAYWAPADLPTVNSVVEQDISTDSVVGGLDLGYNLQAGHLVLGLDGGAYATNTDKTIETFSVYPSNANGFTIRSAVRSNWFVKLAPKVGYIYRDFLFELSGGLAFASITTSFDLVQEANNGRAFAENNKIQQGWVVGAGLHYALSDHWSINGKYTYANFGNVSARGPLSFVGVENRSAIEQDYNLRTHMVSLGVNYRF
tara:strand:+ start:240 stop:1007 length:768 start_codon:yes stop_codon:yes gene_type:complete